MKSLFSSIVTYVTTLSSQLPKEIKIVEIADRGYGKSILLKNRLKRQELFVIRGRSFKEPWFLLVPSGKEDILSTMPAPFLFLSFYPKTAKRR